MKTTETLYIDIPEQRRFGGLGWVGLLGLLTCMTGVIGWFILLMTFGFNYHESGRTICRFIGWVVLGAIVVGIIALGIWFVVDPGCDSTIRGC